MGSINNTGIFNYQLTKISCHIGNIVLCYL